MVLEVVLVEDGVYESGLVGNTCSIGCGIGTVQSQVEREVGELLLYLVEILEIEGLLERTGTVPERYRTLGLLGLEQVHQMASHGGHTGTTANEDKLLIVGQVVGQEELSVGARDGDLVTRFERVDVRRADTRIDIHETTRCAVERRCRDTHVELDDVALGGICRARISTYLRLGVDHLEIEYMHLLPILAVLGIDIYILEIYGNGRHVDLDVTAAAEIEVLAFGQFYHELLDEGSHVVV